MVVSGLLIAAPTFRVRTFHFLYWTGLLISASMGYFLGGVLMRPVIDPIPFSLIAVHGLLGAGLGLYPLFWMGSDTKGGFIRASLVAAVSAGLLVWVLGQPLLTSSMEVFSLSILILGGLGQGWPGRLLLVSVIMVTIVLVLSGLLLPGQWISVLGILLIAGCYAGYFRKRKGNYSEAVSEGMEMV